MGSSTNAAIPVDRLDELAPLAPGAGDVLAQALQSGRLSARGLHRVRRVARTVADLQEARRPAHRCPRRHRAEPPRRRRSRYPRSGAVGMSDDRTRSASRPCSPGIPTVGPRRLRELLHERGAEARLADGRWRPAVDPARGRGCPPGGRHRDPAGGRSALPGARCEATRNRLRSSSPLGDLTALDATRVAIVGTRRCTGAGAGFARELGRDLTEAGVAIVSGLALGIDGASHRGVLDAGGRPIGVVGSGLDVVYPNRHRDLWDPCAAARASSSARPRWARDRPRGGSRPATGSSPGWPTSSSWWSRTPPADRCTRCGRPPTGRSRSWRSLARSGARRAAGTNQLLADGCAPVRDATDVLVALGLSAAARGEVADRAAATRST